VLTADRRQMIEGEELDVGSDVLGSSWIGIVSTM
jgi:hypothetical protein